MLCCAESETESSESGFQQVGERKRGLCKRYTNVSTLVPG